jgi:hypothetical protein
MASELEYLKTIGRAKETLMSNLSTSPVGKVGSSFMIKNIESMKGLLASQGRNANGALSQSLAFKFSTDNGIVTYELLALDYWDFINSGVNGIERAFGSPYSFRSLNPSPAMIDSLTGTGSLRGWMAAKGINTITWVTKDGEVVSKGLYDEDDYKQAAWVFAKAIKRKGITPSHFVDDTILNKEALIKFQDDIFEAFNSML